MSAIALRPARTADAELLFAVMRAAMRSYVEATWGEWDDARQRELFAGSFDPEIHRVIEEDGRPVGGLAVEERADHVFLARLFLLPEAQRRGTGTRLVRETLHSAHARGLPVALTILKVNPARRLYERLGFRVSGETETHYRMQAEPPEAGMPAGRVLDLLAVLGAAGFDAWIDGGWGVDALLGRQTRPHADLDLVVSLDAVERIREVLGMRGFALAVDELPVRFVLAHPRLGRIDFHPVSFDADGAGWQAQPGGGTFRYPPEGFVSGSVAGSAVRCISAPVQMLCHQGYEPTPKDAGDVLALHRELGAPLPAAYRRFL